MISLSLILLTATFLSLCLSAESVPKDDFQYATELISEKSIATQLASPNGVAVRVNPDGSFIALAVGTGTYEFEDEDDMATARQIALMKAKKAMADFLGETLTSADRLEKCDRQGKADVPKSTGKPSKLSPKTYQTVATTLAQSSENMLQGASVLKQERLPGKGKAGSYRVVLFLTSKNIQSANAINKALDQAKQQPSRQPSDKSADKADTSTTPASPNTYEVKHSTTDF